MIDLKKILKFAVVIFALIVLAQSLAFFDPKNEVKNQVGFSMFKTKVALAQFFFPRYPERLKYVVGELNQASEQLVYYNDELKNLTNQCSCENTKSQCGQEGWSCGAVSPKAFGETCPQRKEIEKTQIEIQNKIDQISFLRELLQKEMESGLKAELETLREDEAIQLENGLNDILASSQNIITPANANLDILNDEQYAVEKQCQANCEQGIYYNFEACIGSSGEQDNIELEFEAGIGLKKLDLGKIGIDKIGLNLPDKIELGTASLIKNFNIPLPDLNIDIPQKPVDKWQDLSLEPIIFHPPSPSLPTFPWANFSCPTINAQNYQCLGEEEKSVNAYIDLEWYLQTFSWLSEKCQEIPGLKDQYGMPIQECFDKERVHLTIINQCETLWQQYFGCIDTPFARCDPPPGICASILSSGQRTQAIQRECQNLFKQLGETVPPICNLAVLETKCSQIKESWKREIPEPCEFLPLFTKKFEKPASQTYQETTTSCPSQTISDTPLTGIRLDCPISAPALSASIPKIKLPDIIIPDVRLPSFSFPPFLKVKLPNFIFEDLIFPDLKFCNLDDCGNLLPPLELEIPYPILKIPDIEVPPVYASIPGFSGLSGPEADLKIEMNKIEFPPIPIPLPEFDLTKLVTLNYGIPEIPLPEPEIILNFKGVKINAFNILLGLVSSIIPIPSGCIAGGINFIPLVISFPDYYFYWPRFPEIPDLCNNQYNSTESFCQSIRQILNNEVVNRAAELQNIINQTIQSNVQDRLDQIATEYEQLVREVIIQKLDEIKNKIEEKLAESLKLARVENGLLKVPPSNIPLEDITVPMERINALLQRIPTQVPIPWPEELKEIKLSQPVGYQLPSIPLNNLSYKKEIKLKLPGFQYPSIKFSTSFLGNYSSCEGQTPSGGNPYPVDRINVNLGEIINLNQEINQTRESISEVLR